jgi:hypothetical protein
VPSDFRSEFRFDFELDVRGGARLRACFGTEEIEVPLHRGTSAQRDLEGFEAGITRLGANAVLAVLNDRVVNLQLPLRSDDTIGAITFVIQIAENAEFPVVARIVNQRRLREDTLQPELVSKKPDKAAARADNRILIKAAAKADDTEDLVFLQRERDEYLPRNVDRIASYVVLKIRARIDLDSSAGMIVDDVLEGEKSVNRLEVIRQTVVRAAEIEPLIFDAGPEIPISGNQKAMSVAKIVVERIAVAELAVVVVKITTTGVVELVIEKLARILFCWSGGGLDLRNRTREDAGRRQKNQSNEKGSSFLHGFLRLVGANIDIGYAAQPSVYRRRNILARNDFWMIQAGSVPPGKPRILSKDRLLGSVLI